MQLGAKERVLLVFLLLLAPVFVCEIRGVTLMRDALAFRENASMPQPVDLLVTLPIALALTALRYFLTRVFKSLGLAVLAPSKRSPAHLDRFAAVLFKFLYYCGISCAGFWIMKDETFLPRSLGGHGTVLDSFDALHEPPSQSLKLYVLVQLAYQIHNAVYILVLLPLSVHTLEMTLHDLAAMLLIASAFLVNLAPMAAVTGFLNDVCDVVHYGYKSAVDTGSSPLVEILHALQIATLVYLRTFVFPTEFLYTTIVLLPRAYPQVLVAYLAPTNVLLCTIQLLQVYWNVSILRSARSLLTRSAPAKATAKLQLDFAFHLKAAEAIGKKTS